MEFVPVAAELRKERGKGPARRARAAGRIPAICYGGAGGSEPLALDPKGVMTALRSELGRNSVIQLSIAANGGGPTQQLVMIKEYQVHPISQRLLHADLVRVDIDKEVRVDVPLRCVGRAIGVQVGGNLHQIFHRIPVVCKPDKIPVKLEVDVTPLEIGDGLKAQDVPLPAGVQIGLEPNRTIVSVVAPEKEEVKEEAVAAAPAEGEAAAAAPGAEGAVPGAPGAAPAAPGAKPAPGAAPAAVKPAAPAMPEITGRRVKKDE
jgi:large subunit ribosomal protein L25